MMRKKGQVQMGESIAVIIIVIILIFFGVIFWNNVSRSSGEEALKQDQELETIQIANLIPNMPELKCYEGGSEPVGCLDWYKIIAFNKTLDEDSKAKEYYAQYFAHTKITIVKVYPEELNVTIFDASIDGAVKGVKITIPVNIYDPVLRKNSYGLIVVDGYHR